MMRGTPRAFVGTVAFRIEMPAGGEVADAVRSALAQLPGVSYCHIDARAGLLVVTAAEPVDRAEVVAMLTELGCRVEP